MHDTSFLSELVLLVALAAAAAALFERLRLPAVVGFLVVGATVGPGGLGWVDDVDRVRALAELGVVFLLFEVGLELPLERVRRLWRQAAAAGGLQIAATVAVVAVLALLVGVEAKRAWVLGAIVAMSSTALVIGLLSGRGELDSPQGQLSVGILLMQDLCLVPFLLAVPLLASPAEDGGVDALLAVGRSVLALVVLFVGARTLLPRLLAWLVAQKSRELFTLVAFVVVLGSAWVAEEIGLTLAVGAFAGGLVLSATPYAHQLFAEVLPLRGVLLGLFFTAIGMLLDPVQALAGGGAVLFYVAAVVGIKTAVVTAIVAFGLGQGVRLGLITGLGLAQTGEFSFVLAQVASEAGLLDDATLQAFVAGSILTLAATPGFMALAPRLARSLPGDGAGDEAPGEAGAEEREGPVLLLGFGLAGQTLARVLRARDISYVGADANPIMVQRLRERGEPVVFGDVTRRALLQRVGIRRARIVVVTVSDAIATRETVRLARELAPETPLVARTRFVADVDGLFDVGAGAVVAEEFESTLAVLGRVLRHAGIPESAVDRFAAELREEGYEALRSPERALDPWLAELLEEVSPVWLELGPGLEAGATLGGLDVRRRTGCSVLAVDHRGLRTPNPSPDQALVPGDRVLALGRAEEIEGLRRLLGVTDEA